MRTRVFALVVFLAGMEALLFSPAYCQTTYHFHKEVASTGFNLLSTAAPDAASITLSTPDLKGKTGSTWIANWATATGVPNSAGIVPANSTFSFSVWMSKSGSFGTIFPVVMVGKLDSSQNTTAWATATASTALTTTLSKITFNFNLPSAQTLAATDRWWVEVGAFIPSTGSTTHSVTASFAFEGTLNGNFDSTTALPAIIRMPNSISIAPQNPFVVKGSTQQFTATGTYSDGSTADLTSNVSWSSSSTQVATISSTGLMTGQAAGNSTISAVLGTVGSSTGVTVTQSALVSISVAPSNLALPLGQTMELSAVGNFADGSTQDFTHSVTWSSSQPSIVSTTSTGAVTAHTQGTSTISAMLSNFSGSATVNVGPASIVSAVISPVRASLAPNTNQQLSLMGSYSDGTSLDVTSVASWQSSTSNVATVNSAGLVTALSAGTTAISGTVGGLTFTSNVTVTSGPPVITASVSPTPNSAGWNNVPVTVTFSCTPGSAAITACSSPQVVSSEAVNQVVTGTVTDSLGNTASTSVTINLDQTPPAVAISAPADGSTISTATVTATGTLSDALSGLASLTCNGATASFSGGNFSCNISLNPGVNLIAVRVLDNAGNVSLAKLHVTDPIYPAPGSLRITPVNVNLAVGQTQQFTTLDSQGRPRPDATWTLPRNTTLATITTGSSPVLTASAVGQVALTATVQGVSAQTTVNIASSTGSSNWTVPPLSGLVGGNTSVGHFAPAAPTNDGPGLYSVEAGSTSDALRALTTDGRQLWQQPLITAVKGPDLSGGLLLSGTGDPNSGIADLDAQTGSVLWSSNFVSSPLAVRADGNVVGLGWTAQQLQQSPRPPISMFLVNGANGQSAQIPIPESSISVTNFTGTCGVRTQTDMRDPSNSIAITADTDGNAYFEYLVANTNAVVVNGTAFDGSCGEVSFSETVKDRLVLVTVAPDGTISTRELANRTYTQIGAGGPTSSWSGSFLMPGSATPDGQGGVLATWSESFVDLPSKYMVSHVSSGGQSDFHLDALDTTSPFGSAGTWPATVVLDDGSTGFVTSSSNTVPSTVVAFDTNSGQQLWAVQPGIGVTQMFAQDGGGVIVQGFDSSNNPIVKSIDASGNVGSAMSTGSLLTDSWSGDWFSVGPGISSANLPFVVNQASFWPQVLGNPSQNGFGAPGCPCLNQATDSTLAPQIQANSASADEVNSTSEIVQAQDASAPSAQPLGPSNCPICNLPQPNPNSNPPVPSQCVTQGTGGATYLILVGDPGRGDRHNVVDLFNLAAQTRANEIQAQGNKVIACRISSIQDFNQQLTHNGLITGDLIYFGHSGIREFVFPSGNVQYTTNIFVGQEAGPDTNITAQNVNQLCSAAAGCNIDNFLSKNTAIRLNGCNAGSTVLDGFAGRETSIAKLIAVQLKRGVFAYDVGMYFSRQNANDDKNFNGKLVTQKFSDSLPIFLIQEGTPGDKPAAKPFCPVATATCQ